MAGEGKTSIELNAESAAALLFGQMTDEQKQELVQNFVEQILKRDAETSRGYGDRDTILTSLIKDAVVEHSRETVRQMVEDNAESIKVLLEQAFQERLPNVVQMMVDRYLKAGVDLMISQARHR